MLKKAIAVLATLALLASIVVLPPGQTAEAAGANFNFTNASTDPTSPITTTDEMVTLNGTINNVDPNQVTYSIYQIVDLKTASPADDVVGSKRENVSSNIYINGTSISVFNLQLFPGLNKITFVGKQGFSEVTDTFYIDYRNGPVLFDLKAGLDGNTFLIDEDQPTVVYSNASRGQSTANISITGNAPNATSVQIVSNGQSYTYPVNSQTGWTFTAAPVNLKHGKNLVTIKVTNNSQVIETTREIAFYNGSVTFFDSQIFKENSSTVNGKIDLGENAAALEFAPNFSVADFTNLKVFGKAILPNAYYNGDPHPDPSAATFRYSLKSGNTTIVGPVTQALTVTGSTYEADPFFEFEYVIDLSAHITALNGDSDPSNDISFDQAYELKLEAENAVNVHNGMGSTIEGTADGELTFSLRNSTQAYIYDVNYISGYFPPYGNTAYDNLSSIDMENANLFNVPIGVEVLIGNPHTIHPTSATGHIEDLVKINQITDANGVVYTSGFEYKADIYPNADRPRPIVTRTVNGVPQQFLRVIVEITKLPRTGSQTIQFQLDPAWTINGSAGGAASVSTEKKNIKVTLVYGPYVQFKGIYDGMQVYDDTTSSTRQTELIDNVFKEFAGQLMNVANPSDIRYTDSAPVLRTVYFYINNTQINLESADSGNPNSPNFVIPESEETKAYNALISGENTFTFELRTTKNTYQKKFKVNLIPSNLPVIPAPGTNGVFPYTPGTEPNPSDSNFTRNGAIYSTNLATFDVFGTFDFIDLGTSPSVVNTRLSNMTTDGTIDNYIVRVESPGQQTIEWKLSQQFTAFDANGTTTGINTSTPSDNRIQVRYDLAKQSFTFRLPNQLIPSDGSSRIFNITVFNSGTGGPRATYRLEIDPTSLPYSVVRPLLPQKRILNSNFVEVILYSEGADSVVIQDIEAEKISYDVDGDNDLDPAFKAIVPDLKANRDSEIEFTITRGDDEITDSITVRYEPTNIPGAQFLEEMSSKHDVFDKALNLTFERGTSLIRRDYNDTTDLKNQIFSGHSILFGIANPQDGVVDRREYENRPAGFDNIVASFGARFNASFPQRFIKSSPVFWIDAGLADDLNSSAYDPVKIGADPYQYPSSNIPTYDQRPANRELVPSKRGELTLAYDPKITNQASTTVAVFRYDPVMKYWQNLGGTVDEKKHTITVPFDRFGYYVVAKQSYSFTDITQHPYGRNYMDAIFSKGIMNAISFGEFGTDYYVTRGEFATMVVKALEIPLDYEVGRGHFDDVPYIINPDALWDYRYIETAARAGIVRGTLPRVFEPNNYLTREQAASILATALNMKLDTDMTKVEKNLQKLFKDFTNIAYYFQPAVAAIAKEGFIQGSPIDPADPKAGYSFEPKSRLTRADASIIIARVMADMKKLPELN